eukprot:TCALIF_06002-PA protein Name:"Similar to F55H2.5 Putative cytochrome b561 (Caenorhabditis elegans)" AED:0.05 eAED:0.05 QI:192/0.75/0.6/1/0.75/1/5/431/398
MPPKTTKVQPVRVESSKSARGKSGAKKITDEPLPPISGDAKDQAGNGEVNNERVIHENEIYNEYDLDGHRLESPEPTTRWGKFRRRVRHWWKDSTLKARKEECMKQFHEWRHRKHDDDSMSPMSRCWLGVLILLAQILLNGVMALCLFWVIKYHSQDYVPFAWKSNPKLEFNLHPVLMIAGFIYFMGQAMILYRTCRCCRRIWNKLLHTMLHILAIPCIVIGFIAVLDSHNLRKDKDGNPAPIPNFYSLHSWIGLTAMGLFGLQFVVGFFSFLLLLCCESATASFRANLVPLHAAFGGTTFVLAVAAACTGLTEKAFFSLSFAYSKWVAYLSDEFSDVRQNSLTGLVYTHEKFEESLAINALGAGLVALAIVIPVILAYPRFRYSPQRVIAVTHDRYS